jgi:hypothetical protein
VLWYDRATDSDFINLPTMVIFLSIMSNEGDVMPPHVFTKGLRVNNDEFINILETKPWMD